MRKWISTALVWASALLVSAVFCWIVGGIIRQGMDQISLQFLTEPPQNSGRSGGIGPILVSTALILGVCMTVSIPIGVGAAIFLSEFTLAESVFGLLVRRSLDILAGVPSIVFGLFGYAFFSRLLGLGFSILS
jgi:phosphate transport system permease protein